MNLIKHARKIPKSLLSFSNYFDSNRKVAQVYIVAINLFIRSCKI